MTKKLSISLGWPGMLGLLMSGKLLGAHVVFFWVGVMNPFELVMNPFEVAHFVP